jgi:VWFA-related protein
MKLWNYRFAAIALAATVISAPAQTPAPAAAQQTPTIKSSTEEVLLDIVVRDKKGKPINDIKPDDLNITDNGAKQTVNSFRLVQGAEAISHTGEKVALDPMRQVRLVTLAFESMGEPDQRLNARKAAIDLIKGDQGTNVFYAVVMINSQLMVLQQFTNDKASLTKAIERATAGTSASTLISESNSIKADLQRYLAGPTNGLGVVGTAEGATTPNVPTVNTGQGAPANTSSYGAANVQAKLVSVMLDMLHMDSSITDGSRLSLESLKSLVLGLGNVPGRKSVLYFTWGLYMPTNLDEMFRNLMSMANRNNVTFYTVDTRGVLTYAQNSGAASALAGAANASKADVTSNGGGSTKYEMQSSDNAENSMRDNAQLPLRDLAESTGGFLVGDSNDLRVPLRRINEEISSYYEISYSPAIANYDGSFRKIKVDVPGRKDLVVHARSGYFALPPEVRASGLQVFELPLLKAISDGLSSKDVDYRAAPILLKPQAAGTETEVIVEVPLRTLQTKTETTKTATTLNVHCSLAALVKDDKGQVVQKMTRDRSLQVTEAQMKGGNFFEKLSAVLPPGKYSLQTAVMDRESGKIGAQTSEFTVEAKSKGVSVSSIAPVRSYNPNQKPADANEPFQYQGGSITPMLNSVVVVANENAILPLFFTVYTDSAISAKPTMEIEFLQNGKELGKLPLPLADADSQGRIQTVFSVPAGKFPEGVFELRAVAHQGDSEATSKTEITIKKTS